LPPVMQNTLLKYHDFYKKKHASRILDWHHSLGTATIIARFDKGEKELIVSLYQAVVLLLFSDWESVLSYLDIKARTGINESDLRRILQSLACGDRRVLKKSPAGKNVDDSDRFVANRDFTYPRTRVQIPNIAQEETPEEHKATTHYIDEERKHYVDAAIVRIMKSKKHLHQRNLITDTIKAVSAHFQPDVSLLKARIEDLLEREYLERDQDDRNIYHYLA